jgi:hypothetical protein
LNASIIDAERIPEPKEINDALAGMFGYNRFGEGLFRVVWGQTEATKVCLHDGKYTEMLFGHNKPCWLLQRWCAPEMFWTPELYYAMSCDEDGLSLTGEYPQFGRYDTLITFIEQRIVDGEMVIETIPLSYQILESLIPVLQSAEQMTLAQVQENAEAMEAVENAAKIELIANRLEDAAPAFRDAVSYAGQRNRTGSDFTRRVEKKKKQIAVEWEKRKIFERRPKPMRGFFQEPT